MNVNVKEINVMQFNNISVYFYNYPTFNISVFLQIIRNGVRKEFCVYFSLSN